jgi:hypothetical protein
MPAASLPFRYRSILQPRRRPAPGLLLLTLLIALAGIAARAVLAQTPEPGPADRQADAHLFLPVMVPESASCLPELAVQSLGQEPSKVVLVTWEAQGACAPRAAGPLKVECSGLMAPGSAWTFGQAQLPNGSRSGALFSFSARKLSDLGVRLPMDDVAADWMCESLFFGVVGDADDYDRFLRAFRDGSTWASVPLGRIVGSPIGAQWKEDCGGAQPSYQAQRPAAASRFSFEDGAYLSYLPWLEPGWTVLVQNLGTDCARARLWFAAAPGKPKSCDSTPIAPGETWRLAVGDCVQQAAGAWVSATGPVAVVARLEGQRRWASYTGQGAGGTQLHLALPRLATDLRIMVQNPSTTVAATVVLRVRGGTGAVLLAKEATVPARQTSVIGVTLAELGDAARQPLSLLLESTGGPDAPLLPVIAVAMPDSVGATGAIGGAWSLTAGERAQSGAALLGLPSIGGDPRRAASAPRTSRILLHNSNEVPGFTDVAVFLYDPNGFLGVSCQRLNARHLTVMEPQSLDFLRAGMRGTALVSATYWEHEVFAPDGRLLRNMVALQAAVEDPWLVFSDPGFHQGLAAGKREAGFAVSAALPACPPAGGTVPTSVPRTATPAASATPSPETTSGPPTATLVVGPTLRPRPSPTSTPVPHLDGRSAYLPALQVDR